MNKKQEKSAESKLIVSRCIITQISGWVKFTVCIHYPLYWWQCNVAFEHVHGLTETPKHHAGHEKDHQEILHCWGVTLLKGVTLSAPTPGLASLIIKSNHSRGVSPQMGESTFPPSLPPSLHPSTTPVAVCSPSFVWVLLSLIRMSLYLLVASRGKTPW